MVKKTQKNMRSKVKLGKHTKKRVRNSRVRVIETSKIMTDKDISDKEGEYFPESHYNIVVKEDADVYGIDDDGSKKLLLRFRKNVIPKELCKLGMENLKKAAMKKHDNRGAAAGFLDMSKMPKYANDPKQFVKRSKFRIHGYISRDTGKHVTNSIGNLSMSNIIGYFDRYDRNIKSVPGNRAPPCRTTAFTSQQVSKWKNVIPLIRVIDRQFKRLIPDRYRIQYQRAHQNPFVIKYTAFSTLTINYNWRTALHKDAGDLKQGYGNLVVLEDPGERKYEGGYTGFPQYGVCVDVRDGDFLAMDVHEWHCNTEITPVSEEKGYSRLSLVAYLREGMIKCKDLKLN